jgi:DNA-binding GntR family transcriptional regulator
MARPNDDTIQRVSVVDNVTERLRTALLTGDIQPGERIRVTALEKRFGVSHIPIREALRRLETEGLVVTLPQRAAVAAGVALEDLTGIYDLRRIIETQVARRAVEQMTDEQVELVKAALAELEEAAPRPDSPLFWERHRDFHWAVLEPGANAWVRRMVDQLWLAAERYVRLFVSETLDRAMQEHRELAAACRTRLPDRVEEVLLRHLDNSERAIREGLQRSAAAATDDGGAVA